MNTPPESTTASKPETSRSLVSNPRDQFDHRRMESPPDDARGDAFARIPPDFIDQARHVQHDWTNAAKLIDRFLHVKRIGSVDGDLGCAAIPARLQLDPHTPQFA